RNNNELVAILGNFVNRVVVLTHKYFGGKVPAPAELQPIDTESIEAFKAERHQVESLIEAFRFRDAQKEAMNMARIGNKYLADTEPWKLAKTDMTRVATILNIGLQITANLATVMEPFLPFSAQKILDQLNLNKQGWDTIGSMDILATGHQIGQPVLLFEKIDDSVVEEQLARLDAKRKANEQAQWQPQPIAETIDFSAFEKLDIRVGLVTECTKVPKADKLLQFKIDDGLGGRTIVSGIAKFYNPEDLVGKRVLFIANLAPRKLKGIESQGMILSAEDADGNLSVVTTSTEVKPGCQVK
ncbi:MAG: methionine--tRNA ligase subunit beta, partial [Bacteroidales bacterium]|nr:methionine--tRNA ligase subunit beta [Bacteroidales bacterium]